MSEHVPIFYERDEEEMKRDDFAIRRISDGFEFGHGAISAADTEPHINNLVDKTVHSSEILVPVDTDENGQVLEDDGCSDGRGTKIVFKRGEKLKRSLNRAKVFGGAVAMTAASRIGLGLAQSKPVPGIFEDSVEALVENNIDFGAHTDEHANGDDCGCGAIDRAPEALLAALKYEEPIKRVVSALGLDTEGLDEVYENFRSYLRSIPDLSVYSGRKVMERIIDAGKVVKQLGGVHRERRIILNNMRGFTVNQKLIREATNDEAQAFAVDTWRLEDIATELYPGEPETQHKALLSEVVYTLAVAAVLTKGDLPVDMIDARSLQVSTS